MNLFRPGTIVITQGDPKSLVSWVIRLATGSWWTHGFVCVSDEVGVEAVIPLVTKLNIAERIAELERDGRDYVVMDLPGLTDDERQKVASAALTFVGSLYDIWNCLYYVLFDSWKEGGHRLICSQLMAASYFNGVGRKIFTGAGQKLPKTLYYRLPNLEDGWCTPDEMFRYSDLTVTYRERNVPVSD